MPRNVSPWPYSPGAVLKKRSVPSASARGIAKAFADRDQAHDPSMYIPKISTMRTARMNSVTLIHEYGAVPLHLPVTPFTRKRYGSRL
jgi:hypothetical protein